MKMVAHLLGRNITVKLSRSALKALDEREHHLCLEMELYFSCMIRKQVNVRAAIDNGISVFVNDMLEVGFRPVMTKSCSVNHSETSLPDLSDFPLIKPERYIPNWLNVDYIRGEWQAEFGYNNNEKVLKLA